MPSPRAAACAAAATSTAPEKKRNHNDRNDMRSRNAASACSSSGATGRSCDDATVAQRNLDLVGRGRAFSGHRRHGRCPGRRGRRRDSRAPAPRDARCERTPSVPTRPRRCRTERRSWPARSPRHPRAAPNRARRARAPGRRSSMMLHRRRFPVGGAFDIADHDAVHLLGGEGPCDLDERGVGRAADDSRVHHIADATRSSRAVSGTSMGMTTTLGPPRDGRISGEPRRFAGNHGCCGGAGADAGARSAPDHRYEDHVDRPAALDAGPPRSPLRACGRRRGARDPHLLGVPRRRPRVQGEEAAPPPLPRLPHAGAASRDVPRGGAAQPAAGAGRVLRRALARAPRRRRADALGRRRSRSRSSTRWRCGGSTRRTPWPPALARRRREGRHRAAGRRLASSTATRPPSAAATARSSSSARSMTPLPRCAARSRRGSDRGWPPTSAWPPPS